MRLYIGLIHYPVYNKHYHQIASAITSIDLHDLSRLSKTYGVRVFFVITPLEDQQRFAERILNHWLVGYGATYNPNRKEALALIEIVATLEEAVSRLEGEEAPLLIATDASRHRERSISYGGAADIIHSGRSVLLLFGTAWGLDRSVLEKVDYVLDPIEGVGGYNHLSVRAAAAIILDRLVMRNH
jgi:hypothetical protein